MVALANRRGGLGGSSNKGNNVFCIPHPHAPLADASLQLIVGSTVTGCLMKDPKHCAIENTEIPPTPALSTVTSHPFCQIFFKKRDKPSKRISKLFLGLHGSPELS